VLVCSGVKILFLSEPKTGFKEVTETGTEIAAYDA
jgi:hypothetical protein